MSEYTTQDLFIWADKVRQSTEQVARAKADVKMLEDAVVSAADSGHNHSTSQFEFAQAELTRVLAQYQIAFSMIKEVVADLDKAA